MKLSVLEQLRRGALQCAVSLGSLRHRKMTVHGKVARYPELARQS